MNYLYNEVKREEPSMISIALRLNSMRMRSPSQVSPPPAATPEQISEYKERLRNAIASRHANQLKKQP
ncbi:hypothetical protein [Comamonas jiangduensis]|jgi:hypothetical protein|uniref:hypothetical protein n=1 Tax=Comamonas jiangduensis TaxID=1194168 RepID=UPI001584237F|nr:hypothetical protein [Comamonas jiangduensis]